MHCQMPTCNNVKCLPDAPHARPLPHPSESATSAEVEAFAFEFGVRDVMGSLSERELSA